MFQIDNVGGENIDTPEFKFPSFNEAVKLREKLKKDKSKKLDEISSEPPKLLSSVFETTARQKLQDLNEPIPGVSAHEDALSLSQLSKPEISTIQLPTTTKKPRTNKSKRLRFRPALVVRRRLKSRTRSHTTTTTPKTTQIPDYPLFDEIFDPNSSRQRQTPKPSIVITTAKPRFLSEPTEKHTIAPVKVFATTEPVFNLQDLESSHVNGHAMIQSPRPFLSRRKSIVPKPKPISLSSPKNARRLTVPPTQAQNARIPTTLPTPPSIKLLPKEPKLVKPVFETKPISNRKLSLRFEDEPILDTSPFPRFDLVSPDVTYDYDSIATLDPFYDYNPLEPIFDYETQISAIDPSIDYENSLPGKSFDSNLPASRNHHIDYDQLIPLFSPEIDFDLSPQPKTKLFRPKKRNQLVDQRENSEKLIEAETPPNIEDQGVSIYF